MRKIKFLAMVALLAVTTSASAQFTNSTGGKSSSLSNVSNTDGWSTLWVEWNPSTLKIDAKGADDISFTGLSVGYSKAFSVAPSLFLEAGLGVQYSFYTDDDDDDLEIKTNLISAKVPVNLMYAFQIPNSSVALIPFVGANLRFNISGTQKLEYDDGYYSDDEDFNLFDKKDMGSSDATWKRFQIGYQIGVKARFTESFLVGLSYGSDLSEIVKKTKVSTTSITLGYTF